VLEGAYVEASWDVPPSKVLLEEKVYAGTRERQRAVTV
jgi:hypothetical protein